MATYINDINKMAAGVNQGKLTDERILGLKENSEIPNCVKCLVLEMGLKETIDELSSAQVIIDLLRSEMCVETEKSRRKYTNGICGDIHILHNFLLCSVLRTTSEQCSLSRTHCLCLTSKTALS